MNHRRCPFCNSDKLHFDSKISYGHGYCGFEGWIECECGARHGYVHDYGHPLPEHEHKAWNIWDSTERPFVPEDYIDEDAEEETEEERLIKNIARHYGDVSLIEFLKQNSLDK